MMFKWWKTKNDSGTKPDDIMAEGLERKATKQITDQTEIEPPAHTIDLSPQPQDLTAKKMRSFQGYGSDWMDEVISEAEKKGDMKDLPGLGKPLKLGDDHSMETIFREVLKHANYLPPWVELQHEIRDEIAGIIKKTELHAREEDIMNAIEEVNRKISKYNRTCPTPFLQKSQITKENIRFQYEKWL